MTGHEGAAARPIELRVSALQALSTSVEVPNYARGALRPSVVHIGVGGFHRAHLAVYVDDLCRVGRTDWAITGVGLLAGDAQMAEVLATQDHLYTLILRDAGGSDVRVIGSIIKFIHALPAVDEVTPTSPGQRRFFEAIVSPDTHVVSLTITEGGYPVDDVTREFRPERSRPGGVFDLLAKALDVRRQRNPQPLTVMSCDNIMTNGDVARAATLGEADRSSAELAEWIEENISFPNSMVDRITPVTTPGDKQWLEQTHGIIDRWPVVAEPFRQWVIEDEFAGDRLPLEELDVITTTDIAPYELTKLRLLNAGHSCLAYLASLSGHCLVHEAMADADLRRFVDRFLHLEAKPTLPDAAGIDLDQYIASLLHRFANPGISDQVARLCLDGTSKIPKFILPTVRDQLAAAGPVKRSATALAGWCEYLRRSTL